MFILSVILNGLIIVVYVSLAGQGCTHETVYTHSVEYVLSTMGVSKESISKFLKSISRKITRRQS